MSMMRVRWIVLLLLLAPFAGLAQEEHHAETLGSVSFATSCNAEAQPQVNRAVALMHSFQFGKAIEGFHATLASDPSCAIAYWGIALSNWGNPFAAGFKTQAQLIQGLKAVEDGRALRAKTDRERAYIDAAAHLYTDTAQIDQHTRVLAYENAMSALSMAYPEDTEAAIFYALALAAAADPTDKTYAKQLKAGAILDKLFVQYPNHPGLAHYIIHTYDVPALAGRAAEAARRYGEIAPSTPHALHMPSHTFTRLGEWEASIEANVASEASARKAGQPTDELHAMDYLMYAYLQTAQDEAARRLMDSTAAVFAKVDPAVTINGAAAPGAAYFARAAIPARYCLERLAWADAAKLEVHPSPSAQADAMTYFARGLGAAHEKDLEGARSAIESLAKLRDKLTTAKDGYWANQVEIERTEVGAWLAFAEGKTDDALAGMRVAAEMEDKTEKNVVTPGPLAPARELLGELLLDAKRPGEALKEFEATLVKEPNRFRSLYGAAEAAKLAGDPIAAKKYFSELLKIAEHGDRPGRAELAEARS